MNLRARLEEWYKLKDQLKEITDKEMSLRKEIFKGYFPDPVEGANTFDIGGDFLLKGTHKLNRKVDIGVLTAMGEELKSNNIPIDNLVEYKPGLIMRSYRQLTDVERNIFDACLIVSEGSPTLEIVAAKRK